MKNQTQSPLHRKKIAVGRQELVNLSIPLKIPHDGQEVTIDIPVGVIHKGGSFYLKIADTLENSQALRLEGDTWVSLKDSEGNEVTDAKADEWGNPLIGPTKAQDKKAKKQEKFLEDLERFRKENPDKLKDFLGKDGEQQ